MKNIDFTDFFNVFLSGATIFGAVFGIYAGTQPSTLARTMVFATVIMV